MTNQFGQGNVHLRNVCVMNLLFDDNAFFKPPNTMATIKQLTK